MGRTVFFHAPDLKTGFCKARSVEDVRFRLGLVSAEAMSEEIYKKSIHIKKKGRFWTYILRNSQPIKVTYPQPVNAEYVCKEKGVLSKTLCFCHIPAAHERKASGRPRMPVNQTKYFYVTSKRLPIVKRREVDYMLRCPLINILKISDGREYCVLACHDQETVISLNSQEGLMHLIFKPIRRKEYEDGLKTYPFKCSEYNTGGVDAFPSVTFRFKNMPRSVVQSMAEALNTKSFDCYLSNTQQVKTKPEKAEYSGVMEFHHPVCINNLPQVPPHFVWVHVSRKYGRKIGPTDVETKATGLETIVEDVEDEIQEIEDEDDGISSSSEDEDDDEYNTVHAPTRKRKMPESRQSPSIRRRMRIHALQTELENLRSVPFLLSKKIAIDDEDDDVPTKKRKLPESEQHLRSVPLLLSKKTVSENGDTISIPSQYNINGRYAYWLCRNLTVWQVLDKLPRTDWLGVVSYERIGVVLKTAWRRRPIELNFMQPLTSARYRKIERTADKGQVYASMGDMSLRINSLTGSKSPYTRR